MRIWVCFMFAVSVLMASGLATFATAQEEAPETELLDPGQAPRIPLRLEPRVGAEQRLAVTQEVTMRMEMDGVELPVGGVPTVRTEMSSKVLEVNDDGSFRVAYQVDSVSAQPGPGVEPLVVEMVNEQLAGMLELRFQTTLSDRGAVLEQSLAGIERLDDTVRQFMEQMEQAIEQINILLPEAPVGVGGSWRVRLPIVVGGIELETLTTYTVTELLEDGVSLAVLVEQHAGEQAIDIEQAQNLGMRLISQESTATGVSELLFHDAMPRRFEMDLVTRTVMGAANGEAESEQYDMRMTMRIDMASIEDEPKTDEGGRD